MKLSKEIKKELHEYIDNIDDEETLCMVHEEVEAYLKKEKLEEKEEEEDLTQEQIAEFNKAVKEMQNGEFETMDDFKKAMSRWITK